MQYFEIVLILVKEKVMKMHSNSLRTRKHFTFHRTWITSLKEFIMTRLTNMVIRNPVRDLIFNVEWRTPGLSSRDYIEVTRVWKWMSYVWQFRKYFCFRLQPLERMFPFMFSSFLLNNTKGIPFWNHNYFECIMFLQNYIYFNVVTNNI
jgi:hypothetical protein